MATVPASRRRVKVSRTIRLALPTFEGNPGVVEIRVGKESNEYLLQPIGSDFGTAFRLTKFGSEGRDVYDVHLSPEGRTCECKGFARWGRCKHADGIAALIAAGKL